MKVGETADGNLHAAGHSGETGSTVSSTRSKRMANAGSSTWSGLKGRRPSSSSREPLSLKTQTSRPHRKKGQPKGEAEQTLSAGGGNFWRGGSWCGARGAGDEGGGGKGRSRLRAPCPAHCSGVSSTVGVGAVCMGFGVGRNGGARRWMLRAGGGFGESGNPLFLSCPARAEQPPASRKRRKSAGRWEPLSRFSDRVTDVSEKPKTLTDR